MLAGPLGINVVQVEFHTARFWFVAVGASIVNLLVRFVNLAAIPPGVVDPLVLATVTVQLAAGTEIVHRNPVARSAVTPLAVGARTAMFALPSQVMVQGNVDHLQLHLKSTLPRVLSSGDDRATAGAIASG
jgi:hypothetical protein